MKSGARKNKGNARARAMVGRKRSEACERHLSKKKEEDAARPITRGKRSRHPGGEREVRRGVSDLEAVCWKKKKRVDTQSARKGNKRGKQIPTTRPSERDAGQGPEKNWKRADFLLFREKGRADEKAGWESFLKKKKWREKVKRMRRFPFPGGRGWAATLSGGCSVQKEREASNRAGRNGQFARLQRGSQGI